MTEQIVKCAMCSTVVIPSFSKSMKGWFRLPQNLGYACPKHQPDEVSKFVKEKLKLDVEPSVSVESKTVTSEQLRTIYDTVSEVPVKPPCWGRYSEKDRNCINICLPQNRLSCELERKRKESEVKIRLLDRSKIQIKVRKHANRYIRIK